VNSSGGKDWSFETEGKVHGSPAIADLESDGVAEVVFGSDDYVYCLGLNYASSAPSQWYTFRGGNFHTGWTDSDGDFVDDLTETTYYDSDPYTWEGEHNPKVRPTNIFPSISFVLLMSCLFVFYGFTLLKKKKN